MRRVARRNGVAMMALAALAIGCRGTEGGVTLPGPEETKAIAEEGFVFGLPIVMNYAVMYASSIDTASGQFKAPFNVINSAHRVYTWQDTSIVTPNSDTPYSMLFMDLRAEPIVITVPAVPAPRYYSVQLVDGNTFNYGYIGSRATGPEAGSYLIAGPNWNDSTPPGIKGVYRSSTQFSLAIFRTQLLDPADMPNVIAVQDGYKAQPLSGFLGTAAPAAAPAITWPAITSELVKTHFFEFLDFALQFAPASPDEQAARAQLARIGVGSGAFTMASLPEDQKAAILLGMKDGEKKVEEFLASQTAIVNGWHIAALFGDRAFYNGDWLRRAAAAKGGIYGNNADEATYPMAKTLPDGTPLDGSKHNYTLTFAKGQLPPVNAFWSVTMYDGTTQFLIKNPLDRYLINSPMLPGMKTNADGSVTLYIQKDSPGKDKEANWLPAPNGPIYLVMRLYWPKTDAPSILPPGKGTWQPPAVVASD